MDETFEVTKRVNHIQLKLRRVKKGGICLADRCTNTDCDELFIIGVESETLAMNKILTLECLCSNCALYFLDDLITQSQRLAKQILDNDYIVDDADIYEQSVLDSEIMIQNAVKAAIEPQFTLIDELPQTVISDGNNDEFDNGFDSDSEGDEGESYFEGDEDEAYFEGDEGDFNDNEHYELDGEGGDNMISKTNSLTDLDGFEDYLSDFEDDNNENSFERVSYGELSDGDTNPDDLL